MEKGIPYPTRDGIPLPVDEVELPKTKLNVKKKHNVNVHHNYWPRTVYKKNILFMTLRNLERHQYVMPKDVHNTLHKVYEPPKKPTPDQAISEIMRAVDNDESMRLRDKGESVFQKIGNELLKRVIKNYNELKSR